jgi:23S rRNA (uracil1939-C5)-methyltransferase
LPDFDLRMAFHPSDFTQVNGDINRSMIAQALELLSPGPGDRVLDLFCGLGNFTLPLARRAASVCGVEGSQEMVLRGAENAQANAIDNATFHAADLSADVSAEPWAQAQYDRILLDPPRSGALELCQRIGEFGASKIVYISCNPVTLARDAAALLKQGYRLQRAGIMDMFPYTAHVESIAEFTR